MAETPIPDKNVAVCAVLGLSGVTDPKWLAIKSAGRQRVRRAFAAGGKRKAAIQFKRLMVISSRSTASAARPAAPGEGNPKKRRRRANARLRKHANSRGKLTDGQLFSLYASEQKHWSRMRSWLDRKPLSRHRDRKILLRKYWSTEYDRFCAVFQSQEELYIRPKHNTPAEDKAILLFRNTVSTVLAAPPNEAAASSLWRILAKKRMLGLRVGGIKEVPIGKDNIGHRMLMAMGWSEGEALGLVERKGITEPIKASSMAARRSGLGFAHDIKTGTKNRNRRKRQRHK